MKTECLESACKHLKTETGECINFAGTKECHCFDYIRYGSHWIECPEANKDNRPTTRAKGR